jgi:hypothetical protein
LLTRFSCVESPFKNKVRCTPILAVHAGIGYISTRRSRTHILRRDQRDHSRVFVGPHVAAHYKKKLDVQRTLRLGAVQSSSIRQNHTKLLHILSIHMCATTSCSEDSVQLLVVYARLLFMFIFRHVCDGFGTGRKVKYCWHNRNQYCSQQATGPSKLPRNDRDLQRNLDTSLMACLRVCLQISRSSSGTAWRCVSHSDHSTARAASTKAPAKDSKGNNSPV